VHTGLNLMRHEEAIAGATGHPGKNDAAHEEDGRGDGTT
jgi:hypothetical protein